MDITEQLKSLGWNLSSDGFKSLTDDETITNVQDLERKALNLDIREIGGCSFPSDIPKGRNEFLSGPMVVQIQKTRNISAPKGNEESKAAPRMLKLVLSDGTQSCSAIEMSPLPQISMNTPPGTKLLLKGEIKLSWGLLLLYSENVKYLGGFVTNLAEKWNVNREFQNMAKQTKRRFGVEGGAPPWIPFGEKMAPTDLTDKNFKSLDDGAKENKDNVEFEAQRRDAIAEVGKTGCTKKVFGGGTKPLVDKNIQTIIEKGFTLEQAEYAMKKFRSADRALKNLQKKFGRGEEKERSEKEGGRNRRKTDEETTTKPSGKVSLFDYLEEKLPMMDKDKVKENDKKDWEGATQQRFNDNSGRSGRGGRGGQRGGHNSYADRRPKEDFKESKNQRWQNTSHNSQKPPRFLNQNRRNEPTIDHFDHFNSRPEPRTNSESYFSVKSNINANVPTNHFNGYKNNFKMDIGGVDGYNQQNSDYRNQNSSFFKGMPEIPEFPYRDNSSFVPIMQNSGNNRNVSAIAKPEGNKYKWKAGDKCMAKYWEDNKYYNAEVTGTSKKTCVVRFMGYDNFEEVLQDDCIPISEEMSQSRINASDDLSFNNGESNSFRGALEFRRGGSRSFGKTDGGMGPRKNQRYSQPVYMPPPGRNNK